MNLKGRNTYDLGRFFEDGKIPEELAYRMGYAYCDAKFPYERQGFLDTTEELGQQHREYDARGTQDEILDGRYKGQMAMVEAAIEYLLEHNILQAVKELTKTEQKNCGQPWVAEIQLCPRCGLGASEHADLN